MTTPDAGHSDHPKLHSKGDGFVGGHACVDTQSHCVERVEVHTTHLGLGLAAEVYRLVARCLAARPSG